MAWNPDPGSSQSSVRSTRTTRSARSSYWRSFARRAQGIRPPSAQLEGEQMSAELAAGIVARLREMLQHNGDAEPDAGSRANAGPVARVTQEPGDQPDDEQQGDQPGRHSAERTR